MPSIGDLLWDPCLKVAEAWVCRNDSLTKGVGTTESSEIWLEDVTIHISHEDNGVASGLPGAREAERSQKKASWRQVESPRDSKWQCCWE